jgi:hypothetical protein
MAERRSMSQGLSVPDQTSFQMEREFVNEGNISRKKEVGEDIWLPVTFRLPRSLIAELGVFAAHQRAKGRKPWKKQEIIAQFLRQGLQRRIDK